MSEPDLAPAPTAPDPTACVPLLVRRRIEAEFARGLYAQMKADLGEETARRVLTAAVVRLAREAGAALGAQAPGGRPDLVSFRDIQQAWKAEDALTVEELAATPTAFDFNVTNCRYAEMYRELGLAELGGILSCNRDGAFCQGYDPNITMTRTQTRMDGAPFCDFRFRRAPD